MNRSTRTQHEHKHTYTIMLSLVKDDEGPSPNLSKGWDEGVLGDVIKNVKLVQSN